LSIPKILVADDSNLYRQTLRKYISSFGYLVVGEARNGKEAIDLSKELHPDLVILDVVMPVIDGHEACEIIKNNFNIPVVLITAHKDNENITSVLTNCPDAIIIKPIDCVQLYTTINLILRQSKFQKLILKYKNILQKAPVMFSFVDTNYKYQIVNTYYCEAFELPEDEIIGKSVAELLGLNTFENTVKDQLDKALNGETIIYEWSFYFKHFGTRHMSVMYFPYYEDNRIEGAVVISTDITKLKETEEKLLILSSTDSLTNFSNSRHFLEHLDAEINRSGRHKEVFSLLMVDLDDFKKVNDSYGHDIGDSVLIYCANILNKSTRSIDTIGRLGGEEIGILLPLTDQKQATFVAERIINLFNSCFFTEKDIKIKVTASIGVATYPQNGLTGKELLKSADIAMYKAKKNGKNQLALLE